METEGQLVHDRTLKRYKIVGRPGQEEYRLHAGEKLELFIQGQWIPVGIELFGNARDKWAWKFSNQRGEPVFPEEGQRARLVNVAQQNRM
jgi:Domain of unknown function (DUF5348)